MSISVTATIIIALLVGLAAGTFLGWLAGASRARAQTSAQLTKAQTTATLLSERTANLEADAALATELTAAIGPLAAQVRDLQSNLHQQDQQRVDQAARLSEHIALLTRQNHQLNESTSKLAGALHSTTARGDWGEVQLTRIVEYSGMLPHVDFDTQVAVTGARPDMVINLPGGGSIIVDAKVPLSARLNTSEPSPDDSTNHAKALLRHVDTLASKEYWKLFDRAPEFVVCFVPTDGLLSEAAATYPKLIEHALRKNVVIASPSTLLVLLKTVALNWRHYDMSTSAATILKLGTELYERASTLSERVTKLGGALDRAVTEYNTFVGSFESRFLVTARKFDSTGVAGTHIDELHAIATSARPVTAQELAYPNTTEATRAQNLHRSGGSEIA